MRINAFVLIVGLLLLSACKEQNEQSEIHPLRTQSYTDTSEAYDGEKYSIKYEFFVIAKPPMEQSALKRLVLDYNAATLPESERAQYYAYFRTFYRETEATPRDYKDSKHGYFEHDRLEFHSDDLLLTVKWTEYGKEVEYLFAHSAP